MPLSGTTYLFDELVERHPNVRGQVLLGDEASKFNRAKEPQLFNRKPVIRNATFYHSHARKYLESFGRAG